MIKRFLPNRIYRHSNPHASLDILVLNVYHVNETRTKMKVKYITRWSERVQYTGKGLDQHSDTIEIQTKDFENWTLKEVLNA